MKLHFPLPVAFSLLIFCCISCGNGYKKTESGLQYKLHTRNTGDKPIPGDLITIDLQYSTEKDSVIMSTFGTGQPFVMPLQEPTFKGGIEEGFAMLSKGDSATFLIPADSIFAKTFGKPLPPFVRKGSMLTFVVKMVDIKTKKQMDAENEKRKMEEQQKLAEYITKNNVTVKPSESGLYYVETLAGTGEQAAKGKTVSVHYTGKLLDGKVFDSSVQRGQPIKFPLGVGQVIPGWDEGISLMKVGGKATLIIPSRIGYGERGAGGVIPPFAPLVFDVELVAVE